MKNFLRLGSAFGILGGILMKGKQVLMDENFKYRKDEYQGIHITTENYNYESQQSFKNQIEEFIKQQQQLDNELSSVWIKLSPQNIYLLSVLNEMGFDIHHSQNQSIMLNKWMNSNKENKIPLYSTHYVSCAPVLISNDNHILLQKSNINNKWGVPADTLKIVGQKIEELGLNILENAVDSNDNNIQDNIKFQDTLLIREITKTSSGHPDILFAMQFKCNERLALKNQISSNRQLEWISLDQLPEFIKQNQDNIHYPLHYLILERINTLYQANKLNISNPQDKKYDYTYKMFNANSTIFPML